MYLSNSPIVTAIVDIELLALANGAQGLDKDARRGIAEGILPDEFDIVLVGRVERVVDPGRYPHPKRRNGVAGIDGIESQCSGDAVGIQLFLA